MKNNEIIDTNFSAHVKAQMFFNQTKDSPYWGMVESEIKEKLFTFQVMTKFFHGFIVVAETTEHGKVEITHVPFEIVAKEDENLTREVAIKNSKLLNDDEIVKYIDSLYRPHRAPDGVLKPDARG